MKAQSAFPKSVQPGIPSLPSTPKGWKRAPLGMFLAEVRRPIKLEDDEEYDLVTVKRARGGVERRERLLGRQVLVKSQFLIVEGDFLISKRQIVHGACGLVPDSLKGSIVSNEYAVFQSKGNIDLLFVRYLSETVYFQQTCFHSSIGVHVEKMLFKVDRWLRWEFNLPPLHEQRRIARILSTWDKAIEAAEKLITNSKAQKKALMQLLLEGAKRFPEFEEDWLSGSLGSFLSKILGGGTPSRNREEYWFGDIPWVTVKDLLKPTITGAKEGITKQALDNSASNLIPAGSVIVATRMAIGKSALATVDVAINQDLKALIPKKTLLPTYLHYWMQNHAKDLNALGTGSTVKGIQLSDLRSIAVRLPSELDEQEKIVKCLVATDKQLGIYEREFASLRIEKQALMQQLLTGKRRVKLDSAA
jgi:type I restriction enzyme, S subunit